MIRKTLFALAVLSTPAVAGDDTGGIVNDFFSMPSDNVKCVHGIDEDGKGIFCVRYQPTLLTVRFLNGFVTQDADRPLSSIPDFKEAQVFPYGEVKMYDDMTCWSREDGLDCKSGPDGFRISRKGVDVFQ
jgi:hypothetical protein